jgi:methyl-accepting chemotaxis protein
VSDIQEKGKTITELLKNLISMSDDEMRKEAAHD